LRVFVCENECFFIDGFEQVDGDEKLQRELLSLFGHVKARGRQIVVCSLVRLDKLVSVSPDLLAFLRAGSEIELKPPVSSDVRTRIVKDMAQRRGVTLADDAARTLAQFVNGTAAAFDPILSKAIVRKHPDETEISDEIAFDVLRDAGFYRVAPVNIEEIIDASAKAFGISSIEIKSEKRDQHIANARHLSMYLARNMTELSNAEIAKCHGGRDHSTVIHAIGKISQMMQNDDFIKTAYSRATKALNDVKSGISGSPRNG
jgi:chromosomal replication initiator protein